MAAAPVDPNALRALWRAGGDRPLAVAVSGGGDSLALLALLRQASPHQSLFALIVDHAVQNGSAAVAASAALRAQSLGAQPVIRRLSWAGEAATDQASARRGRYRALAEAAKDVGAVVIAVAHTEDDQAETTLIKYGRTGLWGQAGMRAWSPCPVWPEGQGLVLARPLLTLGRARLRAWARAQGLVWHEDQANANPAFARARARAILQADPGLSARLAAHGARAAAAAARRNAAALAWAAATARFDDRQGAVLLAGLPQNAIELRGFAALVGAAAGRPAAAGPHGAARLVAALKAGARAQTLGGAIVRRNRDGFMIGRDPGALLGRSGVPPQAPQALLPGVPGIVDRRLWLQTHADGYEAAVTPSAQWALRRNGRWISLDAAKDVSARWLTAAHALHVLGPSDPFADCDAFKGVQLALGSLS
ncbi:MAG: tRNA lysidine(34) synthetase TilS [Alphaproteobacteria bacterium]|nr:tRNA lysidine(34) synthetase TilS [Alphaproteobacteria bacterium]